MKTQSNANFDRPWSSVVRVLEYSIIQLWQSHLFRQTKFDRRQGRARAQNGERMAGGAGVRMNDSTHS